MRQHLRVWGLTIALVGVSALAMAAFDGWSIKRTPKLDQVIKIRLKASFELAGTQATYEGLAQSKITKIDADGSFTQEDQQISGKARVNDTDFDVPGSGVHSTVFNADGTVKEIKGDGEASSPSIYRMTNLEVVTDPGHPVNVGDTWTAEIKSNPRGDVAAKAEYKVIGEEKLGAFDTVKISANVHETEGADPASNIGTIWLSKADGSIVKKETKWVNAPFPGSPQAINATVTETQEP